VQHKLKQNLKERIYSEEIMQIELILKLGKKFRDTIKKLGGTMPEELPATDSIRKVEKRLKSEAKK